MAIGATATDIANLALTLIGEEPIMNIEDVRNKQGKTVKTMFNFAKRSAFVTHPWACLMKRAALAADNTPPIFGYANSYTLPPDYVRLYRVIDPETNNPIEEPYKMEGNKVLCDRDAPLYIEYTAETDDYSNLHAHVYEVFVHTLALAITLPITAKSTIYNSISRTLKDLINESVFIDSTVDTPPEPTGVDYYGDSRS